MQPILFGWDWQQQKSCWVQLASLVHTSPNQICLFQCFQTTGTCHSKEDSSKIQGISSQAVLGRRCSESPWTDQSVAPDNHSDNGWFIKPVCCCWKSKMDTDSVVLNNDSLFEMETSGLVLALADQGSQDRMLPVLRTACSGKNRDWNLKYTNKKCKIQIQIQIQSLCALAKTGTEIWNRQI